MWKVSQELGTVQEPPTRTTCLKSTGSTPPICTTVAPPICNAVPRWLLSLEERETPQYTSNLYRSAPPICTAVRLAVGPAILLRKYHGAWGSGKFLKSDSEATPEVPPHSLGKD